LTDFLRARPFLRTGLSSDGVGQVRQGEQVEGRRD
jgi:hypothetical protein